MIHTQGPPSMSLAVHEEAVAIYLRRWLRQRRPLESEAQARCGKRLEECSHARCQNGLPAWRKAKTTARTSAPANATHDQVIQVGRWRGKGGNASLFEGCDIGRYSSIAK